jgi:hypothetical protein
MFVFVIVFATIMIVAASYIQVKSVDMENKNDD